MNIYLTGNIALVCRSEQGIGKTTVVELGANIEILIPHLLKINKKNEDLSIVPFTGKYSGLSVSLKFWDSIKYRKIFYSKNECV